MWVLIVIVTASGYNGGGAYGYATSFAQAFSTKQHCDEAAEVVSKRTTGTTQFVVCLPQ